jgi:hypothetical protein
MKRVIVLFLSLALLLTACGSPTPQTIVVETGVPVLLVTDAPTLTDEAEMTDEPDETEEPVATDDAPAADATNTEAVSAGDSFFTDLTRSFDAFSLRCEPSLIEFAVKSTNPAIVKVMLFYRVVDKESTIAPGAMNNSKEMISNVPDNFTLAFAALDLKPDLRKDNGWFDYQFVGLNKLGSVVGRSEPIVQEVTFTLNCP